MTAKSEEASWVGKGMLFIYEKQSSSRVPMSYRLGGVKLGYFLMGKLGRAWVGALVGAWHGAWVHGGDDVGVGINRRFSCRCRVDLS